MLTITGIALWFVYEPTTSQAWGDFFGAELTSSQRLSETLRASHRVIGALAVVTAAATAVALSVGPGAPLRRMGGRLIAAGLVVATVAAMVTGYELPWDQLGLRAVTVGSDLTGFGLFFEEDLRFVLIGGREVDPGTLIRWLVVHVALLGPLVIGLAVVVWRRRSSREQIA